MKRIITCLSLSVLASALSSCYSPSPQFAVAHHGFFHGYHEGPYRYDPPARRYGTESLEKWTSRGSSAAYATSYPIDTPVVNP
jgi:hypothetical protein